MNMQRFGRLGLAAAIAALLGTGVLGLNHQAAYAQAVPNGSTVVKPTAYVSVDKVARGQGFEAAVVIEIAQGFHMNSHHPSEDYLIPTTLTPNPPPGIKLVDTIYPAGKQKTFTFSPQKPLDVYSDKVTLVLKLSADDSAAVGMTELPATLRYQACNDTMCLPPVKLPVSIAFEVAPSGTVTHKAHADVFAAAPKS